jgi:hypothetical protein
LFKLRRVRLAEHEERKWGNKEMHIGFWLGNLKEEDYLENLGVDGKIIRKRVLKKQDGRS